MTGPAEAVFQGVLAPELISVADADLGIGATEAAPAAAPPAVEASDGTAGAAPAIDCSTVCVNGCIRPEACPSAEARARVEALLGGRSLDELVDLASSSLESRTRARFAAGGFPADPGV